MIKSNCPNCNAVLSYEGGLHCDYCGARFGIDVGTDVAVVRDWSGDEVHWLARQPRRPGRPTVPLAQTAR